MNEKLGSPNSTQQIDCFAINAELVNAGSRTKLLQLVEDKGRHFDAVNVSTCLNR